MALGHQHEEASDDSARPAGDEQRYGAVGAEVQQPLLEPFSVEQRPPVMRRHVRRLVIIVAGMVILVKVMMLLA
eukprot:CAMPEP_0180166010 /NCGR_PEP_ID=MMETSP0986-20121125/31316_1 /TAXON_ID=697907 /ORGANISM="non described non described, Strain CCMP2293" /LENGTH=73 /DNA_ID=CAMNT_0022117107 /DNA_START=16 /DNA_END=234 /DNA_ORIENTATION=-